MVGNDSLLVLFYIIHLCHFAFMICINSSFVDIYAYSSDCDYEAA